MTHDKWDGQTMGKISFNRVLTKKEMNKVNIYLYEKWLPWWKRPMSYWWIKMKMKVTK